MYDFLLVINTNLPRVLHRFRDRYTWLPLLCLTPPAEGFPWDDLCEIFNEYQWMVKVPNAIGILPKI